MIESFSPVDLSIPVASKTLTKAINKSGLVMMISGVVFIGVLIYLWYRSRQNDIPNPAKSSDFDLQ